MFIHKAPLLGFAWFCSSHISCAGQRGLGLCRQRSERNRGIDGGRAEGTGWGWIGWGERVDSESAFSSCHSLWGSSIRSCPKNSNGRRFKCKTAGFGAAASLRVWDFYGNSWPPSSECFFSPPPPPSHFFPSSDVTGRWACISEQAHGLHVSGQCVNIHLPTNIIIAGCLPIFLPAWLSLCHSQPGSITTPHGTRACAQHQLFQLPPEMTCFKYFFLSFLFASHTNRLLLAKMDHYQHYGSYVEYF